MTSNRSVRQRTLVVGLGLALTLSAWAVPAVAQAPAGTEPAQSAAQPVPASSSFSGQYRRFAVAADHELASQAGAEILAAGGNAVDAAVATSFALAVVRPFSCGLGGGGFMVLSLPESDRRPAVLTTLNYREVAPAAVGPDFYEKDADEAASRLGGKAVGVPGTVKGLLYALEQYGTLKPADVVAPAARLARGGFAVDEAYLNAVKQVEARLAGDGDLAERFKALRQALLRAPGGEALKVGDVIRQPKLADLLDGIGRDGAAAFYGGEAGAAIVQAVQEDGGVMTLSDLEGFVVSERPAIQMDVAGHVLISMPPPSSGGLAIAQSLGIFERMRGAELLGQKNWSAATSALVESFKHAMADRAQWLADPKFVPVPVDRLMSEKYLDERARASDLRRTQPSARYGTREEVEAPAKSVPEDGGTSHLSVVDAAGGAVACTETINLEFGSLVYVPSLGIVLNNEMDDFTTRRDTPNAFGLKQSEKNLPQGGKRPLSSMSPTIVLNKEGQVRMVVGASGGPRIITATTQVLIDTLFIGVSASEAVSSPRVHHQWMPNVLEIEPGLDDSPRGKSGGMRISIWMRKVGHEVRTSNRGAAVQLIFRREQEGEMIWDAASDPRKGGKPAGQ